MVFKLTTVKNLKTDVLRIRPSRAKPFSVLHNIVGLLFVIKKKTVIFLMIP